MKAAVQQVIGLFGAKGEALYGGEEVSQLQHALQAATFAMRSGATDHMVAAALLHDVGHLLHGLPDDAHEQGIDDLHQDLGGRYLEKHFVAEVSEPARLHVAAKRYMCATEKGYYDQLSGPSKISLQLQGGMMNEEEIAAFELEPYFKQAVQLRKWDDLAKDADMVTEPLTYFIPQLETSVR